MEEEMYLRDTYNIHKTINSIIPFFKSKYLCKKGIHNYCINPKRKTITHYSNKTIRFEHIDLTNLKCLCCGKEIKLKDLEVEINIEKRF